jgi:hypothetical protein
MAQETGVVAQRELSVVYPVEVVREGRLSLKGFGGLTIDNGRVQGGAILAYSVKGYEVGLAGRFLQGRPLDFGLYIGLRF